MQPPCRTESQLCAKRVIPFCTRWFEGQQWIDYFIPSFWALQTFFSQPRQVGFAVRLRRQRFTKRWKDTTSRPWAPRVLADVVQIGSTHVDPQNTFQQSVLTVVGNSQIKGVGGGRHPPYPNFLSIFLRRIMAIMRHKHVFALLLYVYSNRVGCMSYNIAPSLCYTTLCSPF